jgi:hypothetical protein
MIAAVRDIIGVAPACKLVLWVDTIPAEVAFQALGLGVRGILHKRLPADVHVRCLELGASAVELPGHAAQGHAAGFQLGHGIQDGRPAREVGNTGICLLAASWWSASPLSCCIWPPLGWPKQRSKDT